jgi:RNA polymerase sigma-70 factor (ECF subfamily)
VVSRVSAIAAVPAAAADDTEHGAPAGPERLRAIVDQHYDFVWRSLRHLGVEEAGVDDATQQVLCVLARRLADVHPGAEMSFLFATATRVAREARRSARRHPATPASDEMDSLAGTFPSPDEVLDERRAREALARLLDRLPDELRAVFVLYEIEELTVGEIANIVGVPVGTATSRLRRARERFRDLVRRASSAPPATREARMGGRR